MKLAILGYGVEGRCVENYFRSHPYISDTIRADSSDIDITVFDHFQSADIDNFHLENFDVVFRTPSVRPHLDIDTVWTSITDYFFAHCPAPIIGITGTKGKGTTCTITKSLIDAIFTTHSPQRKVFLVGNIGSPALDILDQVSPDDVVVYELSSFQLWYLQTSPHISAVLRIEPDHLDVHRDFDDYVAAKSHIVAFQTPEDYCIYYKDNADSAKIADLSSAHKLPYPFIIPQNTTNVNDILNLLPIPGEHNRENAQAALLLAYAFFAYQNQNLKFDDFITKYQSDLQHGIKNFQPLPHRIEFVRELNNVKYYDDNYSSASPAMDVAIKTFSGHPTILIAGGKDRHLDLSPHRQAIFHSANIKKAILIGENREQLAEGMDSDRYEFADTLEEAVKRAQVLAENQAEHFDSSAIDMSSTPNPVVLMSPGSASFDMFKNFGDRGDQFKQLVRELQ